MLLVVASALLQVLGFGRDVLLVHEAARAGARAAATTLSDERVAAVAREAAGGMELSVTVSPADRGPGDLAEVEVRWTSRLGPLRPEVGARAVAQVEPGAEP